MNRDTAVSGRGTLAPSAYKAYRFLWRRHPDLFPYIYAIQAGENGPVKIGIADRPSVRLKTLQQGNAETLRGLAAWRDHRGFEKLIHQDFAYARIRGEWFRPVPELIELVLREGGSFEDWE